MMKNLILISVLIALQNNLSAQDIAGVKPGISINGSPCLIQNLTFSCTPRTCDSIVIVAGDSVEFCTYQQIFLNTDTAYWMQWQFVGCANLPDTIRSVYPSQTPICYWPRWDSAGTFTAEAYYNGVLTAYPNSDCYLFGPSHWLIKVVVLPNPNLVFEYPEAGTIEVTPNPTDGRFHVIVSGVESVDKIIVVDVGGRIVVETDQQDVDMSSSEAGIYFVNAFTISGVTAFPLIIY